MQPRAVGHVVVDRLGERVGLLEHHADPGAQFHHVQLGVVEVLIVQVQLAFHPADINGVVHAVERPQEGGFTATGRTDQGNHFVLADIQADVMDRLIVGVKHVHVAQLHLGRVHERLTHGFFRVGSILH